VKAAHLSTRSPWLRRRYVEEAAQAEVGHARGLGRSPFIGRRALDSLGAHAKDSRRRRRPGRVRHGHWPRPGSGPGWASAGGLATGLVGWSGRVSWAAACLSPHRRRGEWVGRRLG
jgi:hypothetical protein